MIGDQMTLDSPLVLATVKNDFSKRSESTSYTLQLLQGKMSKLARVDTVNFAVSPDDSITNC